MDSGRSNLRRAVGTALAPGRRLLWAGFAAFSLGLAWVTRLGTRWPSIYYMTGPSMAPRVRAGQYFLAWSPPGRLARGDLVIFRYEDPDGVFEVLRRLAALPGDTIAMVEGAVVLNGVKQRWPYRVIEPAARRSPLARTGDLYTWGAWIVPPDSVVLLSDTRDMLGWPDSRFLGFIARSDILARAALKH